MTPAVKIEHVARVLWGRLIAPHRHGVEPGVHLQPRRVRLLDDVGEGVEWMDIIHRLQVAAFRRAVDYHRFPASGIRLD
jgi:hypothetical protein